MDIDVKATSVVICDDIRREENGKEILIGVYANLMVFPTLPIIMGSFATRIEFKSELRVAEDLTVELRDPDANTVFSMSGYMELTGRHGVHVLSVISQDVQFPKEGTYTIFFGRKAWLEPVYSFPVRVAGDIQQDLAQILAAGQS